MRSILVEVNLDHAPQTLIEYHPILKNKGAKYGPKISGIMFHYYVLINPCQSINK